MIEGMRYLDKKGSNHHVVFLVDEIGQYIGDDSKLKSDALKIRLLNEMVDEDNRLAQQALAQAEAEQKRLAEEARKRGETVTVPQPKVQQPAVKVRTTKNLSIKMVARAASWRLESAEDVDKYLDALRQSLLKELADDSIVNVEL